MAIVKYCTVTQLKKFLQTELTPERTEILARLGGETIMSTIIEEQSADMTATLNGAYETPLALTSDITVSLLKTIACNLSAGHVIIRVWRNSEGAEINDYVKAWIAYAESQLAKYTDGEHWLPGETPSDPGIITDDTDDDQSAFRPLGARADRYFDDDAAYRNGDTRG